MKQLLNRILIFWKKMRKNNYQLSIINFELTNDFSRENVRNDRIVLSSRIPSVPVRDLDSDKDFSREYVRNDRIFNIFKYYLLISILIFSSTLFADFENLSELMNHLLQQDTNYQDDVNDLAKLKAERLMENSFFFGDLSYTTQNYKNDIKRDQTEIDKFENSEIEEEDERSKFEISKTFFSSDFDETLDYLSYKNDRSFNRLNLHKKQFEIIRSILDDLIDWNEAVAKIEFL